MNKTKLGINIIFKCYFLCILQIGTLQESCEDSVFFTPKKPKPLKGQNANQLVYHLAKCLL